MPSDTKGSHVVALVEFLRVLEGAFVGHSFDELIVGPTELAKSPYEHGWPSY
jgi:hypothetical protein